jgi:hypothetical protein
MSVQISTINKYQKAGSEIRVSNYTFNSQNANDSYGTNHGSDVGTPTYQTYGSFESYILYNCSDSNYVTLPSIAYGNLFTISFRLLFEDSQIDQDFCIMNTLSGTGVGDGFQIIFNSGGSNTVKVYTANGTLTATANTGDRDLAFNTIHNIAITFNKTAGTCKIYVNGTDVTSSGTIRTDFGTTKTAQLCKDGGPLETTAWPQPLDEVQIYSDELTQSEVTWQQSNPNDMVSR